MNRRKSSAAESGPGVFDKEFARILVGEETTFIRTVIESLPGIFYLIDEEGNYLLWNSKLENVLECSGEELSNSSPLEFYREEDHALIESKIFQAFEEGEAEVETDLIGKRGGVRRYEITGRRIEIRGKRYILGTGIDISERHHVLVERERNLVLLNQLFENSPVAIIMIDEEQTVLDVNRSFEQIFRYSRNEIIGAHIDELITPQRLRSEFAEIKRRKKASDRLVIDFESVRKDRDGKLIPVLIGVIPVFLDGEFIADYVFYVDISDLKQYEEKVRTSLEVKSLLLKEVHHRVKNNLAIVSGLLNLQKYRLDDAVLRSILTDCEMQVKSISLVHEKLYESATLSRIDVSSYVQNLLNSLREIYDPGNEVEFDLDCGKVRININQAIPVALILTELITNSFKHAFEEDQKKRITLQIREERGRRIRIELQDNGRGLPEEFDLDRVDSMGYTIVKTLIGQLNADVEINGDDGMACRLVFDKKEIKGSSGNLIG